MRRERDGEVDGDKRLILVFFSICRMISLPELERVQLAERADLEMCWGHTGQRRVKSASGQPRAGNNRKIRSIAGRGGRKLGIKCQMRLRGKYKFVSSLQAGSRIVCERKRGQHCYVV